MLNSGLKLLKVFQICKNFDRNLLWRPSHSFLPNRRSYSNIWNKAAATISADEVQFTDEVVSFIQEVNKLVINDALVKGTQRQSKIIEFHHPKELKELLDLNIEDEPENQEQILERCKKVIQYSVKTGHPRFFNQLFGGIDPYGFVGEVLMHSLNTNGHTYEIAPVFMVLEEYLMKKMCQMIGFPDGGGIFVPGGSASNMNAIHLSRYRYNNELKTNGMFASKPLQLFAQEDSHYSILKAASFLGFGVENVIKIQTDDMGRMLVDDLDTKLQTSKDMGNIPIFVLATSGTTVFGSFDPLHQIADVCKKYNIWMHVDAAWGGGALLSRKHKHLLDGIDRADSVAWNPYKMMCAPIQSSACLVKDKDILQECNASHAEYLFMPDKYYDVTYDRGDMSVQCGRKIGSLSLWLMWKAKGNNGFEKHVDQAFDGAQYLFKRLKETEGFRLVTKEIMCTNVSFWYIPPSMRNKEETPEWWTKISQVAPYVKEKMVYEGTMMIQYQPLTSKGHVNFFRIIVLNPLQTTEDLDFIIDEIERLGKDL